MKYVCFWMKRISPENKIIVQIYTIRVFPKIYIYKFPINRGS